MSQPERVADGNSKVTHAQFVGIGDSDLCQVTGVLNLQQGNIALIVATDEFGIEFAPIVQLNANFLRLINNVVVGQNIALGSVNDDA